MKNRDVFVRTKNITVRMISAIERKLVDIAALSRNSIGDCWICPPINFFFKSGKYGSKSSAIGVNGLYFLCRSWAGMNFLATIETPLYWSFIKLTFSEIFCELNRTHATFLGNQSLCLENRLVFGYMLALVLTIGFFISGMEIV